MPVVTNDPTVLVVPDLSFTVPLVRVNARVEPSVSASCITNVPPIPSNVTGKSSVLPLVVIVCKVVVANVVISVPEPTVIPATSV